MCMCRKGHCNMFCLSASQLLFHLSRCVQSSGCSPCMIHSLRICNCQQAMGKWGEHFSTQHWPWHNKGARKIEGVGERTLHDYHQFTEEIKWQMYRCIPKEQKLLCPTHFRFIIPFASLDTVQDKLFFFLLCSVRPPNKSWKNISNLSGGEKTLSSLALVFALHHYKPTPLYVMDEIDAALDFKNVSIVAHYIKVRVACLPCLDILFPVFQYLSQKFQNNQLFKYLQI